MSTDLSKAYELLAHDNILLLIIILYMINMKNILPCQPFFDQHCSKQNDHKAKKMRRGNPVASQHLRA